MLSLFYHTHKNLFTSLHLHSHHHSPGHCHFLWNTLIVSSLVFYALTFRGTDLVGLRVEPGILCY